MAATAPPLPPREETWMNSTETRALAARSMEERGRRSVEVGVGDAGGTRVGEDLVTTGLMAIEAFGGVEMEMEMEMEII
ncbi:hypothetical protein ACMD2_19309 [Ananas comosus]|uniref:Uncharacterized protein n=1 Tax=Ananas comosus TaxID=4615 RepID=A0A199W8U7_ANACO|nr:hypothetical protein ACMD2_19309 [Ananas comosus]